MEGSPRPPVTSSPDEPHGALVFSGTHVAVRTLADYVSAGRDVESFLRDFPSVRREYALAALALGLEALQREAGRRSRKPRAQQAHIADVIRETVGLTADEVVHRRVLCPACRVKVFARWPEGWDAHAAHRCTGLEAATEELRKAEFKARFGHLFR